MNDRKIFFGTDWRAALQNSEYTMRFVDGHVYYFIDKEEAVKSITKMRDEMNDILSCLEIKKESNPNE